MEQITTKWTKEEFKAYTLLYAAQANFFESEQEKEVILKMINATTYSKIHKELASDNDYQSIQKILYNIEKYNYSKQELNRLIKDIQKVFDADNQGSILEENMLLALSKLFK